jgi:hypothetical protein
VLAGSGPAFSTPLSIVNRHTRPLFRLRSKAVFRPRDKPELEEIRPRRRGCPRRPGRPALNVQVPFFIAAGALLAGIAVPSTAHGLLGDAERVQAEHVRAAAQPDPVVALAVAEGGAAPPES